MEHKDVIEVNDEVTLVDKVLKDGIHEGLKGGRGVAETKSHDEGFEEAFLALKGGFPFIALFDTNVVVTPADVKLCKVTSSAEFVDEVRDQG